MTGEEERTQSPAEAARQALRAARERREAERDADGDGASAAEGGAPAEARPGDAARAALRRAASTGPDGPAESPADSGPSTGPAPARRAAEGAREALRAAREDRRRAQAEAEREGLTAHRPRRAAATGQVRERVTGDEARDTAARRARDVRRLVAGAFRMPSWDDTDGTDGTDGTHGTHGTHDAGDPGSAPAPGDRTDAAIRAAGDATPAEPSETPSPDPDPAAPNLRAPERRAPDPAAPDRRAPDPAAPDRRAPNSASQDRSSSDPATPYGTSPAPAPVPAATPQVPRSMAAPGRDGELRRTFPAFAPRPPDDTGFAETWWGNAWVTALEEGALDVKRLARGRGYAREGHVDAITVTPGLVLAYVRGSRPRPYRVQVRLRTLGDADWARFLDTMTERPAHIAALLDKEMPQSLAEGDVPLLPGPGDLDPRCSCPDRGHPCKHAAALCYQTARLLDADPFVLFLLRGRGERELLDALSRRNAARAARAAQEREPEPLAGVRATEALAAERRLPPLPPPLPAPPHPEQPPVYPAAPGGPDPFALDQLATDAAARAHALLGTGRDPVGGLTLWQDAVRLAAARPGSGLTAGSRALYASLASAAGRTTADLARAVAAWRQGGLEGLAVLEEPWDPPAGRFDRARPLLLAADLPAFRPRRNRLTHPRGHVQLRLGRDGLWYPYESEPGQDDWWPRGTPDLDPVGALTGLGGSQD
ncbi:SWIM zinc finger family protein [Streptomyces sp. NPDC088763]|uniref:SWIM zinc finger family protein n=1 Tax=Streptomyces sp. NPDC088763 TaxID=3365892 RepID=UPI0038045ACB